MEKRELHMKEDHPLQVLLGNLRVVDRERLHLEKEIRRYHGACSELRQNPYLHPDVREFLQEYVDRYDGLWGSRGAETRIAYAVRSLRRYQRIAKKARKRILATTGV